MDRHTGQRLNDERSHIKQSVADILITPVGTRVMRREYGSQLFELIDRPLNAVLALQIAAASVMALKKWENRIEVTRFKLNYDPTQPIHITADIEAVHKQQQTKLAFDNVSLR